VTVATFRYVPQAGDALYTIPNAGAFGFAFSRGTDPSGATLPVAVVQRGAIVYTLRSASAYGLTTSSYVGLVPFDTHHGAAIAGFLDDVQLAWNAQTGDSSAPPSTLAAGARVWGWTAA
jgi:hypothetical protein